MILSSLRDSGFVLFRSPGTYVPGWILAGLRPSVCV
jgi:hypothetical protein